MVDFEPTEEQQLIIETVHQFARQEIRPRARECDESRAPSQEVLQLAHELGLVANSIDEVHGGGGELSALTGVLVAEELAWGDLALALAILSPAQIALPLSLYGTNDQKAAHLGAFTTDAFAPGSMACLEPGYGANPFEPRTRARRNGSGWVIDGAKCLVGWLPGGDTVLVSATTDTGAGAFLVPRDAPGLHATPEQNLGIQALPSVELELSGVEVPEAALLPVEGGATLRALLQRSRVALAASAVGVARAAYEIALGYAKEREAFGAPIATKQAIAFKLADMAIEVDGARLLTWEAAWQLDRGGDATREACLALQQARRVSLEVSDSAVQILGGHGYTREYLPEQQLRNARGFACFEALAIV